MFYFSNMAVLDSIAAMGMVKKKKKKKKKKNLFLLFSLTTLCNCWCEITS